jgi:hypothetical protein
MQSKFGRHENYYKEYILIDGDESDLLMIQQNEIAANKETLLSGKSNSIEKRAIDIDNSI